jgi:hypothetical protein
MAKLLKKVWQILVKHVNECIETRLEVIHEQLKKDYPLENFDDKKDT